MNAIDPKLNGTLYALVQWADWHAYAVGTEFPNMPLCPENLGAAYGSVGYKMPHGRMLSPNRPTVIEAITPPPGGQRRWWDGLRARLTPAGEVRA